MEYMTPRMPPTKQIARVVQYGNPVHQPTMMRPGSTKMIAERVPAAEAIVWTMLFSATECPLKWRNTAIEMTAAGIDVAKVRPTLRPRYTFAAVKTNVMRPPRMMPRSVNSRTDDPDGWAGTDALDKSDILHFFRKLTRPLCHRQNLKGCRTRLVTPIAAYQTSGTPKGST